MTRFGPRSPEYRAGDRVRVAPGGYFVEFAASGERTEPAMLAPNTRCTVRVSTPAGPMRAAQVVVTFDTGLTATVPAGYLRRVPA